LDDFLLHKYIATGTESGLWSPPGEANKNSRSDKMSYWTDWKLMERFESVLLHNTDEILTVRDDLKRLFPDHEGELAFDVIIQKLNSLMKLNNMTVHLKQLR
jgi:hypothetical protein